MSSQYETARDALHAQRCPVCKGSGKVNDASIYDMYYNEWECDACKGTGFDPEKQEKVIFYTGITLPPEQLG